MIENKYFDCYRASIAVVLDENDMNYDFLNIGGWDFSYSDIEKNMIGEKIIPNFNRKVDILERYYGIRTNWCEREKFVNIVTIQSKTPVMIKADLFDCYWNKAYKKRHFNHYFLLKAIKDDRYICDDPYFEHFDFECSKKQINDLIKEYILFDIENSDISIEYIKNEIIQDAKYYYNNIIPLEEFICEMKTRFNIITEIEGYGDDVYAAPIVDNIDILVRKKKSYLSMLSNIADEIEIHMNEIYENAAECVKEWDRLRLVILKASITKQNNKSKLANILENIYTKEKKFRESFYNTLLER